MSKTSFALQSGESVVWQGKPFYRKWGLPFTLVVTVSVIVLAYFDQPSTEPLLSQSLSGIVFVFGLLNLLWVYIVAKYAGVSYYITDRRIVRSQELRFFRSVQEIPFPSLVMIRTRRWLGRNIVVFQSRDAFVVIFANLDEDPLKIRQIAEKEMFAGRQSVLQELLVH